MSNTYGSYGSYGSPADQATRLAAAQLAEGSASTPIRSKWQGAARLAQAVMGGLGMRQAQQGGLDSNAAALKLAQAVSGGGGAMPGGAGGGQPSVNTNAVFDNLPADAFGGAQDAGAMGPPMPAMAPGNAAGGMPPGFMGGGGAPGSIAPHMTAQAGMPSQGVQVASNDPNFMPQMPQQGFPQPSPANSPQGNGGGNDAVMQAAADGGFLQGGSAPQGGGSAPVGGPMGVVAQAETGNRNIPQEIHDINTDHGTPAQGNFQIIDPTWRQYAGKAGVDTSQYPSAIDAPPIVQAQVAAQIPVNQWGPRTVAALKSRYPGLDVNGTLGEAQAQFGGQSPGQANFLRSSVAGPGAPSSIGDPEQQAAADGGFLQGGQPQQGQQQQGDQGGQGGGIPPAMMDGIKQIMLNPYASPEAKQMAEAMMQRYVQPQWETVNRPDGSVIAINKNNPSQNRMVAQPVRPSSFTQIGVDASGNPRYGFVNPATGQIQPADAQGGGGAPASPYVPRTVGAPGQPGPQGAPAPGGTQNIPPPNPAWTPQPPQGGQPQPQGAQQGAKPNSIATPDYTVKRTPGEDAIDQMAAQDPNPTNASLYTRARNIMLGNEPAPLIGVAGTKPVDVATMNIVRQADPNFNSAVATQRAENIKSWQDKTTPTSAGGQLLAANTSLAHMGTLADASDALNPLEGNSQMLNSARGWMASNIPGVPGSGGTDLAAKRGAYEAALQPVTEELTKLYSGGPGAEGDRERMISQLSPDAPAPVRAAAMKTLTTLLGGKVQSLQNQWSQAGFASPFPTLDTDSQAALQRILGPQQGGQLVSGQGQTLGQQGGNDPLSQARAAIAKGAPRAAVMQRLQAMGINPAGL
jgi:hypothetical protein